MKKLFILLVLLIFVFGCTIPQEPPAQKDTFKLGKTFTIKESQTLTEEKEKLTIKAVSFDDSRCPEDVQCIWAGELGATLEIEKSQEKYGIYLGTVTKTKETFSYFEVELISIDFTAKTAELKITEIDLTNKIWFSIEPVQCNGNKWNNWPKAKTMKFESKLDLISSWLNIEHNVKVFEIKSKQVYGVVCEACSCPIGDKIAVLIDKKNKEKMLDLGWKKMITGCTKEAKQCLDGSAVGRTAPFCEFEECS